MAQTAAQKKAAANATMEGQYQFVQDLVSTIPELAALVKAASAQGATPDAFSAMLQQTKWWRTNADTAKQYITMRASDPATYAQRVSQASAHVKQMAGQLGITLTDAQIKTYATTDLFQGLSDADLRVQLGSNFTSQSGATATGDVAAYRQQLSTLAAAYGVPVTTTWTNGLIQSALNTGQSVEEMLAGARASLINSAKSAYPPLASQLDAGHTVQDIAQPYIASMSQILELPDAGIQLTDPTIQKALANASLVMNKPGSTTPFNPGSANTNPAPHGTPPALGTLTSGTAQPGQSTMPLYQFNNLLRADPRWQKTDNARNTAFSLASQLGHAWGYSS